MTPEEASKVVTEEVWNLFDTFSNNDLHKLLRSAGVVPCRDRSLRLHQALVVWFHGSVPNLSVIPDLAAESEKKISGNPAGITKGQTE